jgi:hypothetical protein
MFQSIKSFTDLVLLFGKASVRFILWLGFSAIRIGSQVPEQFHFDFQNLELTDFVSNSYWLYQNSERVVLSTCVGIVWTEVYFKNCNGEKRMELRVGKIYCRRDGEMTAPLVFTSEAANTFYDPRGQKSYLANGRWRWTCGSDSQTKETEWDLVEEVVDLVPAYKPSVTARSASPGGLGKLLGWLGLSQSMKDANDEKMRQEREVEKVRREQEELIKADRIIADMEAAIKCGRRLGDEYKVRVLAKSLGARVYFSKAYEVGWYNVSPASISVTAPKGKAWKRFTEPSGASSFDYSYRRSDSSIGIVVGASTTHKTGWAIALSIMEAGIVDLPHPTTYI